MKRHAIATSAFGILLVCWSTAGEPRKMNIPVADWNALFHSDMETIKTVLSEKNVFPADARTARGRAMMIAFLAKYRDLHDVKNKAWRTLRGQAMSVAAALDKRNYDAARKLSNKLTLNSISGNIPNKLTLKDAMHLFASERMGGYGLEATLYRYLDSSDEITPKQFDELRRLGYRLTALSAMLPGFAPKKDMGDGKTRKNWLKWANGLHAQSIELSATAKANGDVRAVLEKLEANCTQCHQVFR